MIESLNVVHLVIGDGEVFVLASCKEGVLIVQCVGLRVVLISLLSLKILVESSRKQAPSAQVEEAMSFHSQLYATFPA